MVSYPSALFTLSLQSIVPSFTGGVHFPPAADVAGFTLSYDIFVIYLLLSFIFYSTFILMGAVSFIQAVFTATVSGIAVASFVLLFFLAKRVVLKLSQFCNDVLDCPLVRKRKFLQYWDSFGQLRQDQFTSNPYPPVPPVPRMPSVPMLGEISSVDTTVVSPTMSPHTVGRHEPATPRGEPSLLRFNSAAMIEIATMLQRGGSIDTENGQWGDGVTGESSDDTRSTARRNEGVDDDDDTVRDTGSVTLEIGPLAMTVGDSTDADDTDGDDDTEDDTETDDETSETATPTHTTPSHPTPARRIAIRAIVHAVGVCIRSAGFTHFLATSAVSDLIEITSPVTMAVRAAMAGLTVLSATLWVWAVLDPGAAPVTAPHVFERGAASTITVAMAALFTTAAIIALIRPPRGDANAESPSSSGAATSRALFIMANSAFRLALTAADHRLGLVSSSTIVASVYGFSLPLSIIMEHVYMASNFLLATLCVFYPIAIVPEAAVAIHWLSEQLHSALGGCSIPRPRAIPITLAADFLPLVVAVVPLIMPQATSLAFVAALAYGQLLAAIPEAGATHISTSRGRPLYRWVRLLDPLSFMTVVYLVLIGIQAVSGLPGPITAWYAGTSFPIVSPAVIEHIVTGYIVISIAAGFMVHNVLLGLRQATPFHLFAASPLPIALRPLFDKLVPPLAGLHRTFLLTPIPAIAFMLPTLGSPPDMLTVTPPTIPSATLLAGLTLCGVSFVRRAFTRPGVPHYHLLFAALATRYDLQAMPAPFLLTMFLTGVILDRAVGLMARLRWLLLLLLPTAEIRYSTGTVSHWLVLPHIQAHLAGLLVATVLDAPVQSPWSYTFLWPSHPRATRFTHRANTFASQYGGQSTRYIRMAYDSGDPGATSPLLFEALFEGLVQRLPALIDSCGLGVGPGQGSFASIFLGGAGLKPGDFLLLHSPDSPYTFLLHIQAIGRGYAIVQARGLEDRRTPCHEQELTQVDKECARPNGPGAVMRAADGRVKGLARFIIGPRRAAKLTHRLWWVTNRDLILPVYDVASIELDRVVHSNDVRARLQAGLGPALVHSVHSMPPEARTALLTDARATLAHRSAGDPVEWSPRHGGRQHFIREAGARLAPFVDCYFPDDPTVSTTLAFILLEVRRFTELSQPDGSPAPHWETLVYSMFAGTVAPDLPEAATDIACAAWRLALREVIEFVNMGQLGDTVPDTPPAVHRQALDELSEDVLAPEDSPEWVAAVKARRPNMLGLRRRERSCTIIRPMYRDIGFAVCCVDKELVRGTWAGQNFELMYLKGNNSERLSIQQLPALLRNVIVQSADPPIGYPMYVSPQTVVTF